MKQTFSSVCLLLTLGLQAQTDALPKHSASSFSDIDARASRLQIQNNDIIQLSDSLTAPYSSDLEKARAIFAWIGAHIAYDCGDENRLLQEPETAVHPLFYTQQQLENILRTRRTRCDGYAFLFKLMCNLEGIYCTRLEGYLRISDKPVDPATVQANHTWNAALLDGQWYEIDPTAGAGHCADRRFQKQLDGAYFQMSGKLLEQKYIPIEDSRRLHNQGRVILKF